MKRLLSQAATWAEAGAVRAALALARRLPPAAASNLGGLVAGCIGPLLPVSRIAFSNLRLALPETNAAEQRRIVRGVWNNLGRTMAELPHLPYLAATSHGPGWEVVNGDILRDLAVQGGPAIFVSGHIGNWEALPPVVARHAGITMASVYRAAGNNRVDALLRQLRAQAIGAPTAMFPKGAGGARAAMRHLQKGGFLGLLMDQKLNEGIATPFFGHPAMTAPSLALLALRFRCPVIPGMIRRIGPARFRLQVEPPLALPDTGDRTADIATLTADVNRLLERWIRAWPEGWLWLHRRWPKTMYEALTPDP